MRKGRDLIGADDVRARLASVVLPMVGSVLDQLDEETRGLAEGRLAIKVAEKTYSCRMGALIQAHPLLLRIVLLGMPNAVELERLEGRLVPGLDVVVEDLLAGTLASLQTGADVAIAAAASQRRGGFVVLFDVESGSIKVMVAKSGADLSDSVVIGGIDGASMTAH